MDNASLKEDLPALVALIQSGKSAPLVDRHLDDLLRWLGGTTSDNAVDHYLRQHTIDAAEFRTQLVGLLDQRQFADGESPYAILGLSPDASEDDVKTRYYRLLKVLHPDHKQDDLARWTERTERLNGAYAALKRRNAPGGVTLRTRGPVHAKAYGSGVSCYKPYTAPSTWIRHVLGRSQQFTLRFFAIAILFSIGLLFYIYARNAPVEQTARYSRAVASHAIPTSRATAGEGPNPTTGGPRAREAMSPPATAQAASPRETAANAPRAAQWDAKRPVDGYLSLERDAPVTARTGSRSEFDRDSPAAGIEHVDLSLLGAPQTVSVDGSTVDKPPTTMSRDLSLEAARPSEHDAEIVLPAVRFTPDLSVLHPPRTTDKPGREASSTTPSPKRAHGTTATPAAASTQGRRPAAKPVMTTKRAAPEIPAANLSSNDDSRVDRKISIQPEIRIKDIFSQFAFWYEQGNAQQLANLYVDDAVDGEDLGRSNIQSAYQVLFDNTDARELAFVITAIQPVDQQSFLIDARYRVSARYRDGRSSFLEEKARVWVEWADTDYKLKRLLYVK